jgi:tRNA A-37 threonylcarbamoyl transferase component Bud32
VSPHERIWNVRDGVAVVILRRSMPQILPAAPTCRVLKDEPMTRVEVHDEGAPITRVVKTYRCRPGLLWRTFLTPSRAAREFRNLSRICASGVPCVRPLKWHESRRYGCVPDSTLETEYVADAPSLKDVLATLPKGRPETRTTRRRLVRALGTLIGCLHDAGVLGCRITPRNVLVRGAPEAADLLFVDMPAAVVGTRSRRGRFSGVVDLYDAVFSPSRCAQFTRGERLALLLAYTKDRRVATTLWRRHRGRHSATNRFWKGLFVAFDSYVIPGLRALRAGRLHPAAPPAQDCSAR